MFRLLDGLEIEPESEPNASGRHGSRRSEEVILGALDRRRRRTVQIIKINEIRAEAINVHIQRVSELD